MPRFLTLSSYELIYVVVVLILGFHKQAPLVIFSMSSNLEHKFVKWASMFLSWYVEYYFDSVEAIRGLSKGERSFIKVFSCFWWHLDMLGLLFSLFFLFYSIRMVSILGFCKWSPLVIFCRTFYLGHKFIK